MQETLDSMANLAIPQPKAFKGMHFREAMMDHARFNQTDDMLTLCSFASGPLNDLTTDDCTQFVLEVLSDVFQLLIKCLNDPISDKDQGTMECMAALAGKLGAADRLPGASCDLRTLSRACRRPPWRGSSRRPRTSRTTTGF